MSLEKSKDDVAPAPEESPSLLRELILCNNFCLKSVLQPVPRRWKQWNFHKTLGVSRSVWSTGEVAL